MFVVKYMSFLYMPIAHCERQQHFVCVRHNPIIYYLVSFFLVRNLSKVGMQCIPPPPPPPPPLLYLLTWKYIGKENWQKRVSFLASLWLSCSERSIPFFFLRVKFCVHGKALFFSSLLTNFANTWMLKIHIPVYVEMLVWRSLKHTQASVTTWLLLLLLCMIIAEASLSLSCLV